VPATETVGEGERLRRSGLSDSRQPSRRRCSTPAKMFNRNLEHLWTGAEAAVDVDMEVICLRENFAINCN